MRRITDSKKKLLKQRFFEKNWKIQDQINQDEEIVRKLDEEFEQKLAEIVKNMPDITYEEIYEQILYED